MAKFSQGLLQGLMQPAFGQNLYQVGRAAAAGPSMTRASQRMQEEREQTQRGVTGGLFGLEQAAAEGSDYQEAVGSLVGLGATPEQIAQAEQRGQVKRQATLAQEQLQTKERNRKALESRAIEIAKGRNDAEMVAALEGADVTFLRNYIATKPEPEKPVVVAEGSALVSPEGEELYANAPDDKFNDHLQTLVEQRKYTTESINNYAQSRNRADLDTLDPAKDFKPEDMAPQTYDKFYEYQDATATANVSLQSNRDLSNTLLTTDITPGLLGNIRTAFYTAAGVRDEAEQAKTKFIREKNTKIINSLPPGVASDTDIAIFSQGFPPSSAGAQEIQDYLDAEQRILSAAIDVGLLAENFIEKQMGPDQVRAPTFVGFTRVANGYNQAAQQLDIDMQNAKTDEERQQILAEFTDAFKIFPAKYR
jgi:hypothetical protein